MKLAKPKAVDFHRLLAASIRRILPLVVVALALGSSSNAQNQKVEIHPPATPVPGSAAALAAQPPKIDDTPIETSDWGTLPHEAIWDKDGSVMVLIPAGEFTMGLNDPVENGGRVQEGPAHKVYLSSYYIDKYEVTNRQYNEFCQQTGRIHPRVSSGRGLTDPDKPVVGVTWDDANAYAQWAGKELPTEAQWEKAARSDQQLTYPWGNTWEAGAANTKEAGVGTTAAPGSYPKDRSPYGVYDMAGNVSEWVADWYDRDYYSKSPEKNPTGPTEGVFSRVVRGGDYYYDKSYARLTARRFRPTNQAREECGFRCARILKIEATPTPGLMAAMYMPPTPTPVVNPFAPVEAELFKAWKTNSDLPVALTPMNVGRQVPVVFINGLPLDVSISVVSEEPRIMVYNVPIPALQRKEIRLAIDKNMGLFVRIPKLGTIVRVHPIFQSNSHPYMILSSNLFVPTVVNEKGELRPPDEKGQMRIFYEAPKLQWNVVRFYNDTPTTVSVKFDKCPVVDCASDEKTANEPYSVLIGSHALWKATMTPGKHLFNTLYLGVFPSGAPTQTVEVNDRYDHRGVVIQENSQTNEKVRVFARMLPPLETTVLQETVIPYSRR